MRNKGTWLLAAVLTGLYYFAIQGLNGGWTPYLVPAIAGLTALGLSRAFALRWPEPLYAALMSVVAAYSVVLLAAGGLPPLPSLFGALFASLMYILPYSALGMFLLPLADPETRAGGLRPSRRKVGATALVLLGAVLAYALAVGSPGYFGRYAFLIFIVTALTLSGIGALLSLFRPTRAAGAWLGSLAFATYTGLPLLALLPS